VIIRKAHPDDAEAIARVRIDTWRSTYTGILPQDYLDTLSYERTVFTWRGILTADGRQGETFVAEHTDGQVVGFAIGGAERGDLPQYRGELYAIYILPGFQGLGLGKRLMGAAARELLGQGLESMVVWSLERNAPARRFYERMGGRLAGHKQIRFNNQVFIEVAYGWEDIRPLAAVVEEGEADAG
jgi:ribosomal protein S18 acetylase RimI-like enzyme